MYAAGFVVKGLLEGVIGQALLDIFPGQLLIALVGVKDQAMVVPGLEVAAGGDGDRSAVRPVALDRVDEHAVAGLVAEVPLVRTANGRQVQSFPLHAVGRNREVLIQQGRLVASRRIGVERVVDGHVDAQIRVRSGRPVKPISALPEILIGAHDPKLEDFPLRVPDRRRSRLDGLLGVGTADHRAPFGRLMHRPLQVVDLGDPVIVQEKLALAKVDSPGFFFGRGRGRTRCGHARCERCLHEDPQAAPIAPRLLDTLSVCAESREPIEIEPEQAKAIQPRLDAFLRWQIDRPLKTMKFFPS